MRKERDKKQEVPSNLEKAFSSLGIEAGKYKDQYGIDPSRILRYKEDNKGNLKFLCHEVPLKGKELFYILRATQKTDDWKKIISEYQED